MLALGVCLIYIILFGIAAVLLLIGININSSLKPVAAHRFYPCVCCVYIIYIILFGISAGCFMMRIFVYSPLKPVENGDNKEITSVLFPPAICSNIVRSKRLIGGSDSKFNEDASLVLIQSDNEHGKSKYKCGGTLINEKYILTAAHCVHQNNDPNLVTVWTFSYREKKFTTKYGVRKILIHPNYNHKNSTDDIALVELSHAIKFTKHIQPACLPYPNFILDSNMSLEVVGFGKITSNGISVSDVRQTLTVNLFDFSLCKKIFASLELTERQFCAGGEANKNVCTGDSGGPALYRGSGIWYIIGIISFGNDVCAVDGMPSVYTKVSPYNSWIHENSKG